MNNFNKLTHMTRMNRVWLSPTTS